MSFDDYVCDRKYVRNVSPKTLLWYKDIQRAFGPYLKIDSPQLFRESAMAAVRFHLERGVKPVSVNSWLTGIRAYGIWLWKEGKLPEKPRIELLKYERKILATLTPSHIERLLKFPLSKSSSTRRAHLVALTILDCGLRVSECLGLAKADVDMDNLILKVVGKGNKIRLVPFSSELRKAVWKSLASRQNPVLVFGTKNNSKVSVRNIERDFKNLGKKLSITGVRFSPHTLRHTFAVSYLRAGGNLFYLSRILGHTSIKTTERYLQSLGIEDLQAVHNRLSLLQIRR